MGARTVAWVESVDEGKYKDGNWEFSAQLLQDGLSHLFIVIVHSWTFLSCATGVGQTCDIVDWFLLGPIKGCLVSFCLSL